MKFNQATFLKISAVSGYLLMPMIYSVIWFMMPIQAASFVFAYSNIVAPLPYVIIASFAVSFIAFPFYLLKEHPFSSGNEYIYILKRSDGIYKLGRTNDLERRLFEHIEDYQMDFCLEYFWSIQYPRQAERRILSLSSGMIYKEGNRLELRKMSTIDLLWLTFLFSFLLVWVGDKYWAERRRIELRRIYLKKSI